jgi:hypothetical protein
MNHKVTTDPLDQATAAREMLDTLRLLSIKGHVPGEQFERWQAALDSGEPGRGRLAAIHALLESFNWETGDTQHALERVEQIATCSRTESGLEADGSGYLTPADVANVLSALDDATELKRDRAAANCADCDADLSGLCRTCAWRLQLAGVFDGLAAKLGGAR